MYPVIALPPIIAGGFQKTVAERFPGVAKTLVGGSAPIGE
jgi:hypothetical protein